mgnify:FL=1
MEENKDVKTPDGVIDNKSGKEFKTVNQSKGEKNKSNFNFGKTVAVPFLSGVLGAGIVLGTCFGVPTIKERLVETNNKSVETSTDTTSTAINTTQISLENYSETGIAVAKKILPSIVGIKVE